MSNIPSIVEGEASESDNDDTCEYKGTIKKIEADIPHGVIVAGEASESEDEVTKDEVTEELQAESLSNLETSSKGTINKLTDSLLMKKLVECNLSLRNNVLNLMKTTIQNSLEQLTEAEKLLVNSQVRVQRANGSIKSFSSNSTLLVSKLNQSSSYLPHIHIPDQDIQS